MLAVSKYVLAVLSLFLIVAFALRGNVSVVRNQVEKSRMSDLPHLFLWAWERPDDLRSLPADIGVAYLAATLRVIGDRVVTIPRMQPLMVPKNIPLIAVFRIEVDERHRAQLTDEIAQKLCGRICRYSNLPGLRAVQIDFDARQDERPFYASLLNIVRVALPSSLPISITALASWCMCDNWMQKLPIDESVPMFFSMGRDTNQVLSDVAAGQRFWDKRCDRSLGISLDEPRVNAVALTAAGQRRREVPVRIYVFSSKKWSSETVSKAIELVKEK